jgi:hypothetical protein
VPLPAGVCDSSKTRRVASTAPSDLGGVPDGTPLTDIAARYEVSIAAAQRLISGRSLQPSSRRRSRSPRRPVDSAAIVNLYVEGYTQKQVAPMLGHAEDTVRRHVHRAGVARQGRLAR